MEAQSKEDAAPPRGEEDMQTFDDYITQRVRDGARESAMVAKEYALMVRELTDLDEYLEALRPVLAAYSDNRLRTRVRVIEREVARTKPASPPKSVAKAIDQAAGKPKGAAGAIEPAAFPPRESAMEARERMLKEKVLVHGHGFIYWADMTAEYIEIRIEHDLRTIAGVQKSVHFLRRVRATLVRLGVPTVGDIPLDVPFDEV